MFCFTPTDFPQILVKETEKEERSILLWLHFIFSHREDNNVAKNSHSTEEDNRASTELSLNRNGPLKMYTSFSTRKRKTLQTHQKSWTTLSQDRTAASKAIGKSGTVVYRNVRSCVGSGVCDRSLAADEGLDAINKITQKK